MSKLEVILTFNEKHQEFKQTTIESFDFLLTRKRFLNWLRETIGDDDYFQLAKVSCCVYFGQHEEVIDLPKWHDECNGKLYFTSGDTSSINKKDLTNEQKALFLADQCKKQGCSDEFYSGFKQGALIALNADK